jgi:hypothetical protein
VTLVARLRIFPRKENTWLIYGSIFFLGIRASNAGLLFFPIACKTCSKYFNFTVDTGAFSNRRLREMRPAAVRKPLAAIVTADTNNEMDDNNNITIRTDCL